MVVVASFLIFIFNLKLACNLFTVSDRGGRAIQRLGKIGKRRGLSGCPARKLSSLTMVIIPVCGVWVGFTN